METLKNSVKRTVCVLLIVTAYVACGSHDDFHFENAKEALNYCKAEYSKLKEIKKTDVQQLGQITARWVALRDSTLSAFIRDTSDIKSNTQYISQYYSIMDSVRNAIIALAKTDNITLADIVDLKVCTSAERKETQKSDTYHQAEKLFGSFNVNPAVKDQDTALRDYYQLLHQKPFKTEGEMLKFIKDEDLCFRALMAHMTTVPLKAVDSISSLTTQMFGQLYSTVIKNMSDEQSKRILLYLTMRTNRRLVINAQTCRDDILNKKDIDIERRATYRWMLIQPYISIDGYAVTTLTDEQVEDLKELARQLPGLLLKMEGVKDSGDESQRLIDILTDYFLQNHIKMIL